MKLLVTTNGRLYENDGKYYTPLVYGYSFFDRYLNYFGSVRLVAHVRHADAESVKSMLRVDGPNLEVYPVVFPKGKIGYIKNYMKIKKQLRKAHEDCDVAVLRIPDQLAFQIMPILKKNNIPVGIEVTTNSWDLFAKGTTKAFLRPIVRRIWDLNQKKACYNADASSYVTTRALQRRYPPAKDSFTTNYSSVDLREYIRSARDYGDEPLNKVVCMHVSGNIGGAGKGHGELLRAMSLLQNRGVDTKCILVGGGSLSEENQNFVESNKLNVETRGVLKASEIVKVMQEADVFVFPSYREGLPRVVIEAMATGLVCVATNLEGIAELLDDSVMVPVKEYNRIADIICDLISNPEKMSEQSKKNFDKACDYLPEKMEKNRNDFYNYLCERVNKNA